MRRNLPNDEERRGLTLDEAHAEVREDTDSGEQRFIGHAAVFNSRTAIGNPMTWGFYEEIAPGAFTKTLQEADVRFLIDHDPYYVVARTSAGTLHLAQDDIGLRVEAELDPNLSYVNDLKANLRNGNITGMSFGFHVIKDDWSTEEATTADGKTVQVDVRRILEVRLIEVSAVTFPAYEDTDAHLRSIKRALLRRRDIDAIARRSKFRPELAALLDELPEARKAIPPHSTPTSDAPWDGPANVKRIPDDAPASTLRMCFAWVDPDGDPTAKSSYKFPHHFVDADGRVGAASIRACQNGIAILNGARGGADIPDADRQGVYDHLARHLRDADIEPPELKASPGEPGETTRTGEIIDNSEITEPADATREDLAPSIEARMRALARRWGLR